MNIMISGSSLGLTLAVLVVVLVVLPLWYWKASRQEALLREIRDALVGREGHDGGGRGDPFR